jgi:hypothetical protein
LKGETPPQPFVFDMMNCGFLYLLFHLLISAFLVAATSSKLGEDVLQETTKDVLFDSNLSPTQQPSLGILISPHRQATSSPDCTIFGDPHRRTEDTQGGGAQCLVQPQIRFPVDWSSDNNHGREEQLPQQLAPGISALETTQFPKRL